MVASRVLQLLGMAGVLFFILCAYTPLPNLLSHRRGLPAPLEPAEAIVVLGGAVNLEGVLNESSLRSTLHGILLYRQGLAARLAFSGTVHQRGIVEADIRADIARQLGVTPTAILTESQARTTREEAARMAGLLQPMGIRTILLVADSEHMIRAQPLFERVGFTVHPAPVALYKSGLELTRDVVQEFLARLYYRLAGYF
jgi:uncharacterized SAM-binding protein YcdF (DUF218 family)